MVLIEGVTANEVWGYLLDDLYFHGKSVKPRGHECNELTGVVLRVDDARNNIIVNEVRKISYRFMVAEWLWILNGRDDVASISRYNRHIAQFSDDGVSFHGAYGPHIMRQWGRVFQMLWDDPDTRQAVMVFFEESDTKYIVQPTKQRSKDVPCTISLQFLLRDGKLNTIATMRSSDIWLGLPYDMFNFSMLGNVMAGRLGVQTGYLQMNLGSSHLYQVNYESARSIVTTHVDDRSVRSPQLPGFPPPWLDKVLATGEGFKGLTSEWPDWMIYASILMADTNAQALNYLESMDASRL